VIAASACVTVEAMEGTDATILRAGEIMAAFDASAPSPQAGAAASTLSRQLTVVKVAKPNQDMRFDVPVIGVQTIASMKRAGASCLALDAGKCLLIDGDAVIEAADGHHICVTAD